VRKWSGWSWTTGSVRQDIRVSPYDRQAWGPRKDESRFETEYRERAARGESKGARYWHGKKLRIFTRDGWRCVSCGASDALTVDHVIPKSRGGDNQDENLQTMCRRCNGRKANRF